MQRLRRAIEDVQQSPFARHEQLAARLGLLLGQSATEAGRTAIEGGQRQAAIMEGGSSEASGSSRSGSRDSEGSRGWPPSTERLTARDTPQYTPVVIEDVSVEEEPGASSAGSAAAPARSGPSVLSEQNRQRIMAELERADRDDLMIGIPGRRGTVR